MSLTERRRTIDSSEERMSDDGGKRPFRSMTNDRGHYAPAVKIVFVALGVLSVVAFAWKLQGQMISADIPARKLAATQGGEIPPERDLNDPLAVPLGQTPNLPSIRVETSETENVDSRRAIYGGKGDKQHLGGFTDIDFHGVSPNVWKHMISEIGIKSLIDVGCGRGISSTFFYLHGVETLCVEGSHDAVEKTLLPLSNVVEHDFSRGPYWPEKTYDAVWSVEFLEHVGVNYHFNYISTMRKAALLFVTSSRWGGWHHVEVHKDEWWIAKYESYGFVFDEGLTKIVKGWVGQERGNPDAKAPNGHHYNAQHVGLSMKVFINPAVASLPEHAHLFYRLGCKTDAEPDISGRKTTLKLCEDDAGVPKSFLPLPIDPSAEKKWEAELIEHTEAMKTMENPKSRNLRSEAAETVNTPKKPLPASPPLSTTLKDTEATNKERGIWVKQEYLDHLKTLGPIPRKVHAFWPSKTLLERTDLNMVKYGIGQLAKLNPTWDVKVYDDADIGALIQNATDLLPPEELKLLKTAHIVEQTDVARLLLMYREGGLYLDVDTHMNKDLDAVLRNDSVGKHQPALCLPTFRDINFAQSLLCSAPGNNLWKWHMERSTQVRLTGGYTGNARAKPLERLPNGWLRRNDLFKIGPPVYNECIFSKVLDGPLAEAETKRADNIPHPSHETMEKARHAIEKGLGQENSGLIVTDLEMGCTGLIAEYRQSECPPLQKHVAQAAFGMKQWGPEVQAQWDAQEKKQ